MQNNEAITPPAAKRSRDPEATRARLVQATIELILRQGFAATTVDQICAQAGVTKGSFFHHFANKEAIGMAALEGWGQFGSSLYAPAWLDDQQDPLAALGRFFDIMSGFIQEGVVLTCVVGMVSQETAQSNDTLRATAARELTSWTDHTARLIAAAQAKHCPETGFDPVALAWHLNALWQGAMLVGKTLQQPELVRQSLSFALHWLASFFPESVRPLLEANA